MNDGGALEEKGMKKRVISRCGQCDVPDVCMSVHTLLVTTGVHAAQSRYGFATGRH